MAIAAGGVVVSGLVSYFTALVKTRVDIAQVVEGYTLDLHTLTYTPVDNGGAEATATE